MSNSLISQDCITAYSMCEYKQVLDQRVGRFGGTASVRALWLCESSVALRGAHCSLYKDWIR